MPWLVSVRISTTSAPTVSKKLGQPEPDSYLVSEEKSAASHTMQRYVPSSWQSQYSPVKARSVPACWVTAYCSGVSRSRSSSSVKLMSVMVGSASRRRRRPFNRTGPSLVPVVARPGVKTVERAGRRTNA